jgi:hypothetical protein
MDLKRFNSRLVRLAAAGFPDSMRCMNVSIPDWCDWQRQGMTGISLDFFVSIPDWCDWQ